MRRPSRYQIEALLKMIDLAKHSRSGLVRPKDLASSLNKPIIRTSQLLWRLKKRGLVENVVRGGWVVTKKAIRMLEELGYDV